MIPQRRSSSAITVAAASLPCVGTERPYTVRAGEAGNSERERETKRKKERKTGLNSCEN